MVTPFPISVSEFPEIPGGGLSSPLFFDSFSFALAFVCFLGFQRHLQRVCGTRKASQLPPPAPSPFLRKPGRQVSGQRCQQLAGFSARRAHARANQRHVASEGVVIRGRGGTTRTFLGC